MRRKRLILIGGAVLLGWYLFRQPEPPARLYKYTNSSGQIVYTNDLEKVPESQREKALKEADVPNIITADYDEVTGVGGKWNRFLQRFAGQKPLAAGGTGRSSARGERRGGGPSLAGAEYSRAADTKRLARQAARDFSEVEAAISGAGAASSRSSE